MGKGKKYTPKRTNQKNRKLSLYSNLSRRFKTKKDASARKRARYLATLPKNPIKKFFYRLHPKRMAAYWFSKRGALMTLKIAGISTLLLALMVGGLFAYFRKDLDAIRPGEIAKRVQTTVTKYYDRNGELLWEDKGDGNYKLVVESDEISDLLKQATIAIEDQDFYSHSGVSIPGLVRAVINNATGGVAQGGSTLTQQLVKQVFFADESSDRGFGGIPRKIKELILAVEIERMYNKDQILTLYLNESPYGGRRNGAESAAQTYFGKTAKNLSLAESALLASIPQNPSRYDPYNTAGHEILIGRQHTVLDNMANLNMITKEEAEAAKQVPILDNIIPEATQYAGIKAPHFVQMVRSQLEQELGKVTVGRGGLTVTTTLDIRIQNKLEEAMNDMFASNVPEYIGFTNAASTVEDTQTGQIIALMGSRDFNYPGYGQDNAAISYLQPGSTIKPFVFMELFKKKPAGEINYGTGTILKDENIDDIYGTSLNNWDRKFMGDLTIRKGLGNSRNIPAVKAMYISGVQPTLDFIHQMGAASYCTQGTEVQTGLASAIGGCGVKQIDLVNAYASIARQGIYKPQSTVLEVKNNSGDVLKKWIDDTSKRIVDPQVTYLISDILGDHNARSPLYGYYLTGMNIPGVRTGTKTGTSDLGSQPKDLWMLSYSPVLAMGVWLGNSDATVLNRATSSRSGPIIDKVMQYAHKEVYAQDGRWSEGDWFNRPSGIKSFENELYPSWWNKDQGQTEEKLTFDILSKKKATDCTPLGAKIEIDVIKSVDPVTNKDIFRAPEEYNTEEDDDQHSCNDKQPAISSMTTDLIPSLDNQYAIDIEVVKGKFALSTMKVTVDGKLIETVTLESTGSYPVTFTTSSESNGKLTVSVTIEDAGYYSTTVSQKLDFTYTPIP